MKTTIDKQEVVIKALVTLEFETKEEIQTFKNILTYARREILTHYMGANVSERKMIDVLVSLLNKYL